eukprot:TRINITY_DN35991_c0_g1_i1.p1 TRINITY_DN35991_c0_g1~~TRINITY_DN35991_c0_g1_i1.p1  ORF type:complete len:102 (-),score=15.20 TRINITY_DN35991_c0_g1_i1:189-494(-)
MEIKRRKPRSRPSQKKKRRQKRKKEKPTSRTQLKTGTQLDHMNTSTRILPKQAKENNSYSPTAGDVLKAVHIPYFKGAATDGQALCFSTGNVYGPNSGPIH